MRLKTNIKITDKAARDLKAAPGNIREWFHLWIDDLRSVGLEYTQSVEIYRDHKLRANRAGQRSVSLGPVWRVIYKEKKGKIEVVTILEVTPHEY